MPHEESGGVELKGLDNCSEPCVTCKDDSSCQSGNQEGEVDALMQTSHELGTAPSSTISIVISHPEEISRPKEVISKNVASDGDEKMTSAGVAKKDALSESYQELCRICQQEAEEPLIDLGCKCRGELAKAHQSCIGLWFHTRGSNECEICQQAAVNVPFSERQPNTNYWVWRVDPANGGHPERRSEHHNRYSYCARSRHCATAHTGMLSSLWRTEKSSESRINCRSRLPSCGTNLGDLVSDAMKHC